MLENGNKTTITHLANHLHLSKTTISNYLNGNFKSMSEKTRKRIESAIEELNYHPSFYARALKAKKTSTIGVVFSHLTGADMAAYLCGLYDVLYEAGYNVVLFNSFNNPDIELKNLESCVEQQMEGIIVRTCCTDFSLHTQYRNSGIPIVFMDRYSELWPFDAVHINQPAIVSEALEHMWLNGYRRIFLLTSPYTDLDVKHERVQTFEKFVHRRRHEDPSEYIHIIDAQSETLDLQPDTISSTIHMIRESFPGEHKAIFACGGSRLVWQIVYEYKAQSISTPNELGLCVVDSEWKWCKLVDSGISAIYQPCSEMARQTAKTLLLRIKNQLPPEAQVCCLNASLSIGKSTTPSW